MPAYTQTLRLGLLYNSHYRTVAVPDLLVELTKSFENPPRKSYKAAVFPGASDSCFVS
jgi:hypothetical protein